MVHTRLNGEALHEARSAKGLTRHQLARIIDLRLGDQILNLELGIDRAWTSWIILALAQALTVEPMQLLSLPNGIAPRALRLASGLRAEQLAQAAHVSPCARI